jgi:dTDP-4-amino-4,6-dideoxygalactose transaminase
MKTRVRDLAIWGGAPAFKEKLHVGRPNIGDRRRLLERINDILDRRWLSNDGRYVQELERRIAELVGVKHCIATCNATIAQEILARALELKGEVIVPSFTFIATPHALQWLQITPVFGDLDPRTHNLDPRQIEALITPRTSGIIGVHIWGRACAVDDLESIARKHGLKLIFDAAHALGCSHRGRMIGGFGDAEIFSFHATKFFNTFEGGAVVTNNDELAVRIKRMRNFGFAGYDQVVCTGTNGKMPEVAAAMGLSSLEWMDEIIAVNRQHYQLYAAELSGVDGVTLITYDPAEKNNFQYIVLEIEEKIAGISRDDLLAVLHAENVLARRYFYPGCHRMEPYRSLFSGAKRSLPATEQLSDRVLTLPNGVAVADGDIVMLCRIIRTAIQHGAEIAERLRRIKSDPDFTRAVV